MVYSSVILVTTRSETILQRAIWMASTSWIPIATASEITELQQTMGESASSGRATTSL